MKISYDWLKEYINFDIDINEAARILTDTGLEVESIEEGGSGPADWDTLVVGEVLTKTQHPNADRLSCLTVNVGGEEPLAIVCGAPNVEAGQKVVLAQVGTVFNDGKGDSLKIKKSKIRGEESFGMLCSEVELGIGTDHSGIMVLDASIAAGAKVEDVVEIKTDGGSVEIGLTPNRSDATSHIGVARDLVAAYSLNNSAELIRPSVDNFKVDSNDSAIEVIVEDQDACPRYSGVSLSGIKVGESPEWLKNRLISIGLNPINNIVDVTNFVLHETGQPLHAFDIDKIKGKKIVVKKHDAERKFVTLDSVERTLDVADLMICNESDPMCIAGVFGGLDSGVSSGTTSIFIESAYFNPVTVRKTAKRHGMNTDASFRYERGADPNITVFALKRAVLLIQEICGAKVTSEIVDVYANPIANAEIDFSYANCDRLIGKSIERETIKKIFGLLEIDVVEENAEGLKVSVPPFRADVLREVDLIEEVLRIYGYNNVEDPAKMNSSLVVSDPSIDEEIQNEIADLLSNNGFKEMMSNSLTKSGYYDGKPDFEASENVELLNPLSSDLNIMRKSLLFGGLEAIAYNINRKYANIKSYEFGALYHKRNGKYQEEKHLSILATGDVVNASWNAKKERVNYFYLKGILNSVLSKLGLDLGSLKTKECTSGLYQGGLNSLYKKRLLVSIGNIDSGVLKEFDIDGAVVGADINWTYLMEAIKDKSVKYKVVSKFPGAKRDLALLINSEVEFSEVQKIALGVDNNILKDVSLFDVFEGGNVPKGMKSYGLSFQFQDEKQTLTDDRVEEVMSKLIDTYQSKLSAEIR
ncbi:MAG: phenylalanine--tRNA ligase subunit beta [Flavobacteriales bacterium]|nr:phenylalanine--tRNA ligase subunit beta [Flavobacteriales bacterium]